MNARLAPNLYLDVVAITGSPEHPSFKKIGEPIEYTVKMCQFSQQELLGYLSTHDQLHRQHIDDMAREIADFHMRITKVSLEGVLGTPEDIHYWVTDNFEQIESRLQDKNNFALLKNIKAWSEDEYRKKYTQLQQRRANGFIRECHGDMHLGNMVLIEDKVTIFDGIDFNEHLRWIDVMSEVAFLAMDLCDRGHPEFSNRFINYYLQHTGDYEGLGVLKYYLVYRAIVRAKVALLRISQKNLSKTQDEKIQNEFRSYIELASAYIKNRKIVLIITHGLSASGKSTYIESLLESLRAIRIRSDVERKRLHGYAELERTQSNINEGIYMQQSSKATYAKLAKLSKSILDSGHPVIVDACFLQRELRDEFRMLASDLQVPFIILEFQAADDILWKRIINRAENKSGPSEADLEVLNSQLNDYVPLHEDEKNTAITINTEENVQISGIVKAIGKRM